MLRRDCLRAGLALALGLGLAGPLAGAQAADAPKQGGQMIVTYQNDISTLDPAVGYDWQNWSIIKSLFDSLMDYMQLIGAMFIAPFFVIFFLGMFWKRTTASAGFWGMVAGVLGCLLQYVLYRTGVIVYRTPMAATLNLAVWGGAAGLLVGVGLSFVTECPKPENLRNLVYGFVRDEPVAAPQKWFATPLSLAALVAILYIALNVIFR